MGNIIPSVLIGFEESATIRDEFARAGWNAWSCDLKPSRTPGNHFQGDIFYILGCGWDLVILHPPCTDLTVAGNRWHAGTQARADAIKFVESLYYFNGYNGPLAIENPVGVLGTQSRLGPATQYIQPYQFGEDASKKTGLWLRGLPKLKPTEYINPRMVGRKPRWGNQTDRGDNNIPERKGRATERAKTYQGVARAIVDQWGGYIYAQNYQR